MKLFFPVFANSKKSTALKSAEVSNEANHVTGHKFKSGQSRFSTHSQKDKYGKRSNLSYFKGHVWRK
jgi:hypothetical protein